MKGRRSFVMTWAMADAIHHMNAFRYERQCDGESKQLPPEVIPNPSWPQVQAAIRRMDNFCFPIVILAFDPDEQDGLCVAGGSRRFAVSRIDGSWTRERNDGSDQKVRLWMSDLGYYCRERNLIRSKRMVLAIVRTFFETVDFEKTAAVAKQLEPPPRKPSRPRQKGPYLFDLLG